MRLSTAACHHPAGHHPQHALSLSYTAVLLYSVLLTSILHPRHNSSVVTFISPRRINDGRRPVARATRVGIPPALSAAGVPCQAGPANCGLSRRIIETAKGGRSSTREPSETTEAVQTMDFYLHHTEQGCVYYILFRTYFAIMSHDTPGLFLEHLDNNNS